MSIFTREQKQFALSHSPYVLQRKYEKTEAKLLEVSSRKPNNRKEEREKEKSFKQAMKEHQKCEYGLLYQRTEDYMKQKKIVYSMKGRSVKQNNK